MYSESVDPEMARRVLDNLLVPLCWYMTALVAAVWVFACAVVLDQCARLWFGGPIHSPKSIGK